MLMPFQIISVYLIFPYLHHVQDHIAYSHSITFSLTMRRNVVVRSNFFMGLHWGRYSGGLAIIHCEELDFVELAAWIVAAWLISCHSHSVSERISVFHLLTLPFCKESYFRLSFNVFYCPPKSFFDFPKRPAMCFVGISAFMASKIDWFQF